MGVIITTAISIILGALVMKLFDSERRLTGAEVVFASAALCVVLGCLMKWVIELWAEATGYFGLPILPSVFYRVYTPWELVVSPFVQWLILSGIIVFLLKLRNWPKDFDEEERRDWVVKLSGRYIKIMLFLECFFIPYALYKWYPVWGQWFGLIRG